MPTAAQRAAERDMQYTLDTLQDEMCERWIKQSIPLDWEGLDSFDRVQPHKTRITIRLDADLVKFFRGMGPNYSHRMNEVLRIYWKALVSGQINAYHGDDPHPRLSNHIRYTARKLQAQAADKS